MNSFVPPTEAHGAPLLRHLVIIGNYTPRQCGIATFTADLTAAVPAERVSVVAMNDGRSYAYPPEVVRSIEQEDLDAYVMGAAFINALEPQVVSVQHEYGIYGGAAGAYLLTLLRALDAPIVTTLHTVLEDPTDDQRTVLDELCVLSAAVVVMSERARSILLRLGVPAEHIRVIHHGIPRIDFTPAVEKRQLGWGGRPVLLTFGLLGPGKGLEGAIQALPVVLAAHPDALYVIVGATHPHVLRQQGEAYRASLWALAEALGVQHHLRMENRFVSAEELQRRLAAADVYLTPYPNVAQITSGTLAYALGNGKATVSTPYWYAEELLADGRGVLTPFGDPRAMGRALSELLSDDDGRARMGARAAAFGRSMLWPAVGEAYRALLSHPPTRQAAPAWRPDAVPAVQLAHLDAMTDSTGLLQHATGVIPNPHEGYTTDDNARLLGLMARLARSAPRDRLLRRSLGFLHFALDPDRGVFRNFLGYDRQWLEDVGAENTQARAVRALVGVAAGRDGDLAAAAAELLGRAARAAVGLRAPRAQAIALLAAADLTASPLLSEALQPLLVAAAGYATNLLALRRRAQRPGWDWFEPYLSYANAELPHALIAWGAATGDDAALDAGLETLEWLHGQQLGPQRRPTFWPIGSDRVYWRGAARPLWAGQPIEAAVSAAAYAAAWRMTRRSAWAARTDQALAWLLGANARGEALLDGVGGGCRDGLQRDGPSLNQGAESTILAWEAVLDAQALHRAQGRTPLARAAP